MKEDYLWNKTGSDPEIAELEEALAVFRHRQMSAPPFPAVREEAIVADRKPSWIFGLRFALAASAAAVVAASVWIWAVQERETRPVAIADARPAANQRNEVNDMPAIVEPQRKNIAERAAEKPVYTHAAVIRPKPSATVKRNTARRASPALTSEEKYAYDRLMLALSITSSKLRIVRDTMEGNPESDTDRSGKR